jgi:hypothetical protein
VPAKVSSARRTTLSGCSNLVSGLWHFHVATLSGKANAVPHIDLHLAALVDGFCRRLAGKSDDAYAINPGRRFSCSTAGNTKAVPMCTAPRKLGGWKVNRDKSSVDHYQGVLIHAGMSRLASQLDMSRVHCLDTSTETSHASVHSLLCIPVP